MNRTDKAVAESYLREVSQRLDCERTLKRAFLAELRRQIASLSDGGVALSPTLLAETFGSPDAIALSYRTREDFRELLEQTRGQARRFRVAALSAIAVLLLALGFMFYLFQEARSGYDVVGPIQDFDATVQTKYIKWQK